LLSLSAALPGVCGQAKGQPAFDVDLPPTVVRLEWLRHEHQKPKEKSPRL